VVIGGGYIGLEAAAVLAKFGKQVVLLEALDRVLARVAGEPLSRFFEAEHRAHGVDVRLGVAVDASRARTACDRRAACRRRGASCRSGDRRHRHRAGGRAVARSGREGGNGVRSTTSAAPRCPTSSRSATARSMPMALPKVRAIRLESVQNANDQATCRGQDDPRRRGDYDAVPWFWSNQYDLKLQTVGLSTGYDQAVLRGDPATRSFSRRLSEAGRQGDRARLRQCDQGLCPGPQAGGGRALDPAAAGRSRLNPSQGPCCELHNHGVLPAAMAIGLAILLTLGAGGGTWYFLRSVDEVERRDNYVAATIALNFYLIVYANWYFLWKGAVVPEPGHEILFIATMIVMSIAYFWKKLRP
jgi:hypothetical protein